MSKIKLIFTKYDRFNNKEIRKIEKTLQVKSILDVSVKLATCPSGYDRANGSLISLGTNSMSYSVLNMKECASLCNRKEACHSFEFVDSATKCYINNKNQTIGQYLEGSIFCKKNGKRVTIQIIIEIKSI